MATTKKFVTGQVVFTRGVNAEVARDAEFAKLVLASLRRHASGDWGVLDADDKRENDRALDAGDRLLSAYPRASGDGEKIWIITEVEER